MKTCDDAIDIITHFEGFSANPYHCPAGIWTIGYGSTRHIDGRKIGKDTRPITNEEATCWLKHELGRTEALIAKVIKVDLTPNQHGALVSIIYNIGSGNFNASTLRQKLNRGDYDGAADEFPKWIRAGGKILKGLVRRRAAERGLFLA